MKSLRNSKIVAVCGALAVALAVTLVAAPSAEAGCGGYGYGYATYRAPVQTHYVAPVYPTYNYVAPSYYPPIYTPTYWGHGCHHPW